MKLREAQKLRKTMTEDSVVLSREEYDNLVGRAEYAERELALKYNSLEDAVVLSKEEYSDYLLLKNDYAHAKEQAEKKLRELKGEV